MRVHVLYFAIFRERLGKDDEWLEIEANASVEALVRTLEQRYEAIRGLRGRYQIAVNHQMVDHSQPLDGDDEVALIPPVAGGNDAYHANLLSTALDIQRCIDFVSHPSCGAVATFTGAVRNYSQGKDVVRLEYEAYPEMVTKVFRDLCDEVANEFASRVAVEHRVGELCVGDVAVVIAAAAPHRQAAFEACRAMIDRLKDRAPIWKKEFSSDGSHWVGLGP